jgi:hypothetical protein
VVLLGLSFGHVDETPCMCTLLVFDVMLDRLPMTSPSTSPNCTSLPSVLRDGKLPDSQIQREPALLDPYQPPPVLSAAHRVIDQHTCVMVRLIIGHSPCAACGSPPRESNGRLTPSSSIVGVIIHFALATAAGWDCAGSFLGGVVSSSVATPGVGVGMSRRGFFRCRRSSFS